MFDGRGSATEWWMSLVTFITSTNTPAVKAIQMLHLYFNGIALQWFTVLDPVKKSSLDIFKQAFCAQFKPSSLINTDRLSIQKQPGECVKEYFTQFINFPLIQLWMFQLLQSWPKTDCIID